MSVNAEVHYNAFKTSANENVFFYDQNGCNETEKGSNADGKIIIQCLIKTTIDYILKIGITNINQPSYFSDWIEAPLSIDRYESTTEPTLISKLLRSCCYLNCLKDNTENLSSIQYSKIIDSSIKGTVHLCISEAKQVGN